MIPGQVAPLTGSVDRNYACGEYGGKTLVAPLTGSVDRNFAALPCIRAGLGRSPSRGA